MQALLRNSHLEPAVPMSDAVAAGYIKAWMSTSAGYYHRHFGHDHLSSRSVKISCQRRKLFLPVFGMAKSVTLMEANSGLFYAFSAAPALRQQRKVESYHANCRSGHHMGHTPLSPRSSLPPRTWRCHSAAAPASGCAPSPPAIDCKQRAKNVHQSHHSR